MLLIDYRTYAPHTSLGFLFGLRLQQRQPDQPPAQAPLAGIVRIPERKVSLGPDELRELLFDRNERPTNRPTRGQNRYYSGKKRHTLTTQVAVVRVRKRPGVPGQRRRVRIKAVSGTFPGSVADAAPEGGEPAGVDASDRG